MSRIGTLPPLRDTEPVPIQVWGRHCRPTTDMRDELLVARHHRRHGQQRQVR